MKKILLSLVVFSLVFVYSGISLAQVQGQDQPNKPPRVNIGSTSSLEKISNPSQISLFEKIQKIGTILYGIKKQKNNQKSEKPNSKIQDQANVTSSTSSTLEKISSPAEILLFDKIKKIGTALWGVRKNSNQKPNINQPKLVYVTPAAAQCVKDAIDKKDTSLKTSHTNHALNISLAIDTRGTCQKATLDQTTAKAQADANKVCVEAFQKEIKDISKTMETAKKDTFEVYKTDLKSCSALQASSATSTSEVQVEQIMILDEVSSIEQSDEQKVE